MLRFKALEIASARQPLPANTPTGKISEYFGMLTFNDSAMREYLTAEAYRQVIAAIEEGEKIDRRIADQIAASMRAWAINKNATHYTHWFHPLTGTTAEKHDAFINPVAGGKAIENFRGNELMQQEPDASSFPSGGIRNTFEARGYTAWDPASPAFILDRTLCIPTIFVSYTGEALDFKTPMLKALYAVDKAATEVCRYFDKNVRKVTATLGIEQEYFLVDKALYHARPDLMLTRRTVFGHASAKDQQLSDHYFGTIPARVVEFMKEFEAECHKLGIPVKTRHNEVAPSQFECAPVHEEASLAVDHNQLLIHVMKRVGDRHNFTVLLHEKPYAGVNGSGKHNNWSLQTDTGINLLSPGNDSKSNLRFLTFFINILKAVHDNADLIRAAIASANNDHRLGAHEAPPAIMSVFIGTELTKALSQIGKQEKKVIDKGRELNLNIPKIPEILLDNTDRNRTSPFAFTGNKFEFRAVGSSTICAKAMTPLNLILANQLQIFKQEVDALIAKKNRKEEALLQVLRGYVIASANILFEGNSYGEPWIEQARQRGLSNITSTPQALIKSFTPQMIAMYEKHGILSRPELGARQDIKMRKYTMQNQIESRVICDLATNHIIPVAIQYQNILIENVKGLQGVLDNKTFAKLSKNQLQSIREISEHIDEIKEKVLMMTQARKHANTIEDATDQALAYNCDVLPVFSAIRYHVDKLELLIDDKLWPLPKYRELLFMR
ncbi:MAG: glutamine synthetase type III [Bacteroidales bacterium]|nr:glutamine synthetase type III [Bacteroidales bacterium]